MLNKAIQYLMQMRLLLLFVVTNALLFRAVAQETLLLPTDSKCIVKDQVVLQADSEHRFSEKDFGKVDFEKKFKFDARTVPYIGYTDATVWLKFNVSDRTDKRWFLEIDNSRIDFLKLYLVEGERIIYKKILGDSLSFSDYEIPCPVPIFRLPFLPQQRYTVYLEARGREDLKFPITFWDETGLMQHLRQRDFIWGIYFGFIVLIIIYNFFFWVTNHERIFIFYVLYVLSFGLFQASLYGFGFEYLWGNSVFNDVAHVVFITLMSVFLTTFSVYYLNIFQNFSGSKPFFQLLFLLFCLSMVLTLTFYEYRTNIWLILSSFMMLFIQFGFCFFLWKKHVRNVRFYFLATFPVSVGSLLVGLMNLGILPAPYQDYVLMLGSMLEIGLFSISLGDRIRQMHLEKLRQQLIRDEIATNLHDDLAASLSSLTLFSQSQSTKYLKQAPEFAEAFRTINTRSREMMKQLRAAVWEINPQNDISDEWIDKLIGFAQETLPSQDIYPDIQVDDKVYEQKWTAEKRRHISLIFKEAINNIIKYAKATEVEIKISVENNRLKLSITDNGCGFDQGNITNGNGLYNFQKHAKALNATVKIDSQIGKGTTLQLSSPISYYN